MTAAIFNSQELNSLFDNQKKLDDLFDSIFDDDNYFIAGSTVVPVANAYAPASAFHTPAAEAGAIKALVMGFTKQNPYFFLVPVVLEIAAIYFVLSNVL